MRQEERQNSLDKYEGWGFVSLFTQFKSMLRKEEKPHKEITGIVFEMLDRLSVNVKDKNGKALFAIAGKVRQLGDKSSADLLWKMWNMKCDGMLTSPDGYLYKVINSKKQGGKQDG